MTLYELEDYYKFILDLMEDEDDSFFEELVRYHISGQLRVAPEHCSAAVLDKMGKPHIEVYKRFCDKFYFLKAGEGYSYGGIDTVTAETLQAVYGIRAEVLDVKGRKTVIID